MARNKIQDLRNHLFEAIEHLMDPEESHMTIEKAKAIADNILKGKSEKAESVLRKAQGKNITKPKKRLTREESY